MLTDHTQVRRYLKTKKEASEKSVKETQSYLYIREFHTRPLRRIKKYVNTLLCRLKHSELTSFQQPKVSPNRKNIQFQRLTIFPSACVSFFSKMRRYLSGARLALTKSNALPVKIKTLYEVKGVHLKKLDDSND